MLTRLNDAGPRHSGVASQIRRLDGGEAENSGFERTREACATRLRDDDAPAAAPWRARDGQNGGVAVLHAPLATPKSSSINNTSNASNYETKRNKTTEKKTKIHKLSIDRNRGASRTLLHSISTITSQHTRQMMELLINSEKTDKQKRNERNKKTQRKNKEQS